MAGSSLIIVMGAFTVSFAENGIFSTPTLSPTIEPTQQVNTPLAQATALPTNLPSSTPTATLACQPPSGWILYKVQTGDTIEELANRFGLSKEQIREANCLVSDRILPDTELYLPAETPTPTATATISASVTPTTSCGTPPGWITYTVKLNDNFFRISYNYGISVQELQLANCLKNTEIIRPGQVLYVPNVPTRTPQATATPQDDDDDDKKEPTSAPTQVPYP